MVCGINYRMPGVLTLVRCSVEQTDAQQAMYVSGDTHNAPAIAL